MTAKSQNAITMGAVANVVHDYEAGKLTFEQARLLIALYISDSPISIVPSHQLSKPGDIAVSKTDKYTPKCTCGILNCPVCNPGPD